MNKESHPFALTHSPEIPQLLRFLKCSLAISTYQAGKLIFISPKNNETLIQLPRVFKKPMGFCFKEDKLVMATNDEVIFFKSSPELAVHYPKKPNVYDQMYLPRATYYTGPVDIHDIDLTDENEIYAVNTSFSCISKINKNFSFEPYWIPPFISKIVAEDRCHLNGMAMENGKPKYATAFNQGDSKQSWRGTVDKTGVIIDIETNEILCDDLKMPHSPRIYDGKLYVLFSATGELIEINRKTGKQTVISELNCFLRGMAKRGDYLFIGVNKIRKKSSSFSKLKIAEQSDWAGIKVVDIKTGKVMGEIRYLESVDEIYDVQVMPYISRPNILHPYSDDFKMALDTPNTTFWGRKMESKKENKTIR